MKLAATAVAAYLNSNLGKDRALIFARLYTLILASGVVYRWTDYDVDLTTALPVPTFGLTPTGGGGLTAGTKFYRVTVFFGLNESLPGTETSITITAGQGVIVAWTLVPGATAYGIYGRASGAEQLLGIVGPAVTQFTDTSALTPSGAMPSSSPTFSSSGPVIVPGKFRQPVGTELPEGEVSIYGGGTQYSISGYASLPLAALAGAFDNAQFGVDKLFMATPGSTSLAPLVWFVGRVSEAHASSRGVHLTLKGNSELLANLQWPKRKLMPQCPHSLYDSNCGATKAPVTAVVQSGATTTQVTVSGLSHGAYTLGTITFITGETRQIQSMSTSGANDVLTLNYPLAAAPAASINATVLQGCNKSLTALTSNSGNCSTFANTSRFGGFPFVPRPESVR